MTLDSVRAQLAALGAETPVPEGRRNGMRTSPIGAKRRATARREESFYPAWEGMLNAHRLDFWHCYNPMFAKESGWPDYVVFGSGWIAFVELKARSINTGRIGKLSVKQERYRASVEASGAEWCTFVFPDDWPVIEKWLAERTERA